MYAVTAIGAPLLRWHNKIPIVSANVVPDAPEYQPFWLEASMQPTRTLAETHPEVELIVGTLLRCVPISSTPINMTVGDQGQQVVSWAPMRLTLRTREKLVTVLTGAPPGAAQEMPVMIESKGTRMYLEAVHSELPQRLGLMCGSCFAATPLKYGGQCA